MFVLYRVSIEVSVGRTGVHHSKESLEVSFITKNYSPEFWPEGIGSCLFLEETSLNVQCVGPVPTVCIFREVCVVASRWWAHVPSPTKRVSLPAGLPTPSVGKAWAELEHGDHAQWGDWLAQSQGTHFQTKPDSSLARHTIQQPPAPGQMTIAKQDWSFQA